MSIPAPPANRKLRRSARSLSAHASSTTNGDPAKHAPPRVDVLGVHVSVTNPDEAVARIERWILTGAREYVCVTDVNALLHAREDAHLREFYNRSGMTLPDGMPLVWAGKAAGFSQIERVCGPDLLPHVLAKSVVPGWRHYFLGGAEGVAQRLADVMRSNLPGLRVVGFECPPFRGLTAEERHQQIARINASGADIVWVGLGAPKQERWMAEVRPRLDAAVLVGVGAAFNFHTGDVKRAPVQLQRVGLEWAYRLSQEPHRLWKRYAVGIPKFVVGVAGHRPRSVA